MPLLAFFDSTQDVSTSQIFRYSRVSPLPEASVEARLRLACLWKASYPKCVVHVAAQTPLQAVSKINSIV